MPGPVVFVGAATYDAIALVDRMPRADERLIASDIRYAGGGPAATAAVAAKRLGLDVTLIAPIGSDSVGDLIASDLEAEGISTRTLQRESGRASQASVVLCSAVDSTRSIATRGVAPLKLVGDSVEIVRSAKWVHVDHLGWPAVAAALMDLPFEERPRISVDAGHAVVGDRKICRVSEVSVYAPPLEKLVEQYGNGARDDLLRSVPAHSVVATLGSGGSIGRDPEGRVSAADGFAIEAFGSTLGAGDVFHGALTAAFVRELPLYDALVYANAVAALSCRGVDGRSAIPDHTETLSFIKENHS